MPPSRGHAATAPTRMTPLLAIARNAFVESLRQPIVLVVVLLSGVLQYFNTAISAYSMGYRSVAGEVTGDNKLLFDVGMSTVFLCGILVAAFIATAIVSREIENKTVLTIVSKPVGRIMVVVGKYLGVMGATLIATAIMVVFLMFALRHGVLMNASDKIHQPVVFLGVGSVLVCLAFGGFTNYAYGWPFSQTVLIAMLPLVVLAYLVTLPFGPTWKIEPIAANLKPEVIKACIASIGALIVLTSVATAASTRLGQVMTITICLGVFVLGLLSDYFIGRHAFVNQPIGEVETAQPVKPGMESLNRPGDEYTITFGTPVDVKVDPGDRFFYAPSPNGLGMVPPGFAPIAPGVDINRDLFPADVPPALVVLVPGDEQMTVKAIGGGSLGLSRPPESGDSVFLEPTTVNWPARVVWTAIPRLHAFWLVDAVTQASRIPMEHVGLVLVYSVIQAGGFLGLAILLFQGRDLG
ncbi:MAG: ABC transporter permease [Phycisphaeraceae bacterium]|nr:MAG: ABC transporter permease [Phycisphaeraceae bacterium]